MRSDGFQRSYRLQRWLMIGAMLALPVLVYAQEAALSGAVTDITGGALPGVTVRAVHDASGNSFEAVTDARGDYRLAVRVGSYRVTAELSGFAPVTRTVTVLVGQQAVTNLQMGVSGVQESVTVTGEAPLLDTTQSSVGGNIDPRQLQELPVNGRNWLDLVLLAPGARSNAVFEAPFTLGGSEYRGDFQLNVDGQQVTQLATPVAADGQPRLSRDAIAEFEFVSSRFDATQGRSSAVQVNAITKSGANTPSGSFSSYFRDDSLIAADFIAKRVLPFSNQQLSWTAGGPIRRDKLHVFGNFEYEREPRTALYTTPFPHFNRDITDTRIEKKGGVRLDAQFSPRNRLTVRGSGWEFNDPLATTGGGTETPSSARGRTRQVYQLMATMTQVFTNRAVNEVKGGYNGYLNGTQHFARNPRARFFGINGPRILFPGLTAGGGFIFPEVQGHDVYNIRDDFTYSFTKGGRHTLKVGGEYLYQKMTDLRCLQCEGDLNVTGSGLTLTNDLMRTLFPDPLDVSTWNLAPLSPFAISWTQPFGQFSYAMPRHTSAFWVQDDWSVTSRLTLNLGVRYDLETGAFVNEVEIPPFLRSGRPNDTNNIGPRVGAAYTLNDRTVIRGGFGVYYGTITGQYHTKRHSRSVTISTPNDGRADFAAAPPPFTFEQALTRICTLALEPGCIRRAILPFPWGLLAPNYTMPYSYQTSIGFQRQLGPAMAIEADYVYNGIRGEQYSRNVNLTYNPATGANYPFSDLSRRPYPDWGYVGMAFNDRRYNSHSVQTSFTKRFSDGWQASATYTLAGLWDGVDQPSAAFGLPFSTVERVPLKVADDIGGFYSLAASDQRHRAVFNGIWQLKYGFQLSGLYFFGSGERFRTIWGADVRDVGFPTDGASELRLRPDGTLVPRNPFVGKQIHRVDLRIQRRFPIGGRAGIEGIAELFNVFNHANFGSYVTNERSTNFLDPQQNPLLAYAPRVLQLGFRLAF